MGFKNGHICWGRTSLSGAAASLHGASQSQHQRDGETENNPAGMSAVAPFHHSSGDTFLWGKNSHCFFDGGFEQILPILKGERGLTEFRKEISMVDMWSYPIWEIGILRGGFTSWRMQPGIILVCFWPQVQPIILGPWESSLLGLKCYILFCLCVIVKIHRSYVTGFFSCYNYFHIRKIGNSICFLGF